MNEPREIRPECEKRITRMETILENHIPHVNNELVKLKRLLWTVFSAIGLEILGLLFYLIKTNQAR